VFFFFFYLVSCYLTVLVVLDLFLLIGNCDAKCHKESKVCVDFCFPLFNYVECFLCSISGIVELDVCVVPFQRGKNCCCT